MRKWKKILENLKNIWYNELKVQIFKEGFVWSDFQEKCMAENYGLK